MDHGRQSSELSFPSSKIIYPSLIDKNKKEKKEKKDLKELTVSTHSRPKFPEIDWQGLQDTADRIPETSVKEDIETMLAALKKRIDHFNHDAEGFIVTTDRLKQTLENLQSIIVNISLGLKTHAYDMRTTGLAGSILEYLSKTLTELQSKQPYSLASIAKSLSIEKKRLEQHLFLEQKILNSSPLKGPFYEALDKIKKKGLSDYKHPNGVFISYAWPDLESKKEQHLFWLQPFLAGLCDHLRTAGLGSVTLDIQNNPYGGNIYHFMESARTSEIVLLMGTQSLLRKHREGGAVRSELISMRRKMREEAKQEVHRVIPILLNGIVETSLPPEYEMYTSISFWQQKSYFTNLCQLIAILYGHASPQANSEAFKDIWDKFLQQIEKSSDPSLLLIIKEGLDSQSVLQQVSLAERQQSEKAQSRQKISENLLASLGVQYSSTSFSTTRVNYFIDKIELFAPPVPVEFFIPRNDLLKQLMSSFKQKEQQLMTTTQIDLNSKIKDSLKVTFPHLPIIVLTGLGGAGKTQIALNFAELTKENYGGQLWFDAQKTETLTTNYRKLAHKQGLLPDFTKSDEAEVQVVVKEWFHQQRSLLVIYDNVESYEKLKPYLPHKNNVNILITTQCDQKQWPLSFQVIPVKEFLENQACGLLEKLMNRIDPDITKLARELGYLPLALAQAGTYLGRCRTMSIATYLEIYQKKAAILLKHSGPPTQSVTHVPVLVTWDMSLAAIAEYEREQQKSTSASRLLQIYAYLSPASIPTGFLEPWFEKVYPDAKAEPFAETLSRLTDYSLVQLDVTEQKLVVHRLIQKVMQEKLMISQQTEQVIDDLLLLIKLLNDYNPKYFETIYFKQTEKTWDFYSQGISIDYASQHFPVNRLRQSASYALFLRNLCIVAGIHGEYDNAKKYAENSLEIAKLVDCRDLAKDAKKQYGGILVHQGHYAEARIVFEELLAEEKKAYDTLQDPKHQCNLGRSAYNVSNILNMLAENGGLSSKDVDKMGDYAREGKQYLQSSEKFYAEKEGINEEEKNLLKKARECIIFCDRIIAAALSKKGHPQEGIEHIKKHILSKQKDAMTLFVMASMYRDMRAWDEQKKVLREVAGMQREGLKNRTQVELINTLFELLKTLVFLQEFDEAKSVSENLDKLFSDIRINENVYKFKIFRELQEKIKNRQESKYQIEEKTKVTSRDVNPAHNLYSLMPMSLPTSHKRKSMTNSSSAYKRKKTTCEQCLVM